MSSHESTPSGSQEIKISRRGVLTGLFAGAGAAALAACGESKPKPGPTPEVIPSPKPVPVETIDVETPSPSVEATPSKPLEVPNLSEMTIAIAKGMSTEERLLIREKFGELSTEQFIKLPEEARMSFSAALFIDFKNSDQFNTGSEYFGYENGNLHLCDPFEQTSDPSKIVANTRLLMQMAFTTPERYTPRDEDYVKNVLSNAFLDPNMDLKKLEENLVAAGINSADVQYAGHGAYSIKRQLNLQFRDFFAEDFRVVYEASFAPERVYDESRSHEIEEGVYEDIVTGEKFPAIIIPVVSPEGHGGNYIYALVGEGKSAHYKLVGNKFGDSPSIRV